MNKDKLNSQPYRRKMAPQWGMTLLESLVAVIILAVFTGIVALVMQFTLRFFAASESAERNEFEVSNGVLIDHQQIQMAMDGVVEVLSQPGISLERLKGQVRCSASNPTSSCVACTNDFSESCLPQIAFDPTSDPELACPPALPVTHWGLPMEDVTLPPGYRLCLWTTTVVERSMAAGVNNPQGIYLLQALPEQLSSASLPTRRLFCRPRPFC
jgi:prepilin-type N-terminal cleavage/methylation domain-containing protein